MSKRNPLTAKHRQPVPPSDAKVNGMHEESHQPEIPQEAVDFVYVQVDDEVWDAAVAEIMEEYDEVWTRLADL